MGKGAGKPRGYQIGVGLSPQEACKGRVGPKAMLNEACHDVSFGQNRAIGYVQEIAGFFLTPNISAQTNKYKAC